MYPKNVWYVAALPGEVTEKPMSRHILGQKLVFFRTLSGRVAALEDRCPHRLLPLSMGRVVGENIQCGYHGAEFSCDGKCVLVPGQAETPEKSSIRSYPIQELYGLVWIWMGDPELASTKEPCDIYSFIDEGAWGTADGYIHIACDYQLINDNLADTTHTQFVHPTTLGNPEAKKLRTAGKSGAEQMQVAFDYEILENGMQFQVKLCNMPMAPAFEDGFIRICGGEQGANLDFQLDYVFRPPGFWIFAPTTMARNAAAETGVRFDSFIIATPETQYTSHYFHKTCQKYAPDKPEETKYWFDKTEIAFYEDKVVLEEQQKNIGEHDVHDHPNVSFRGDMLGFQVRKFVRAMVESEK